MSRLGGIATDRNGNWARSNVRGGRGTFAADFPKTTVKHKTCKASQAKVHFPCPGSGIRSRGRPRGGPPADAIDRTREAFVRHERGEWVMPAKVYVDAPPHGDFRAMPAAGRGSRSSSG